MRRRREEQCTTNTRVYTTSQSGTLRHDRQMLNGLRGSRCRNVKFGFPDGIPFPHADQGGGTHAFGSRGEIEGF